MFSYNSYVDLCDDLIGGLLEIIMEKCWIHMHRTSLEYRNVVESFLEFEFCNARGSKLIVCPCNKYKVGHNRCFTKEEVAHHLMFNGFGHTIKSGCIMGRKFLNLLHFCVTKAIILLIPNHKVVLVTLIL